MSIWITAAGDELVICDRCGISEDGTRPDLRTMTMRTFDAVMVTPGHPAASVHVKIKDWCPDCMDSRPAGAAPPAAAGLAEPSRGGPA